MLHMLVWIGVLLFFLEHPCLVIVWVCSSRLNYEHVKAVNPETRHLKGVTVR